MKKRKKNNKPIFILLIGLLIFGGLIGFSVYRIYKQKEFVSESIANFEKSKVDEKSACEKNISTLKEEIQTLNNEIDAIDTEITSLERQRTDEFRNSRGFSDRYYQLDDQIMAKRKEQGKKREQITAKNREINNLNSKIWRIDNDFDEYNYKPPKISGISPYVTLGLGIFGCIVTAFVSGISQLFKNAMNDKSYSEYNEIDEGVLSQIDVNNGKLLKKEFFSKLDKLLNASAKDDYNTIRKLCTKNMAKSYIDELDLLKNHNRKLFISDVENVGSKIVSVRKGQHNNKVILVQKVKLIEYIKDVNNNEIVDGDNKKKRTKAFRLVFVKDYLREQTIKKCPNCGANVKDATKVACDYCDTVFDNNNYDWYLESKVIINED